MPDPQKVTVRVSATTANLGPGFDSIGMAVDIWNELTVEYGPFSLTISGDGAGAPSMPYDSDNLVVTGVETAFRASGKNVPELAYRCVNKIPYARGLGSSSAAIVAGLLAGAALAQIEFETDDLIKMAADLDGHPDNVVPAILGGMCIGVHTDSRWVTNQVPAPEGLKVVMFVPEREGPTREARALLPPDIPRSDAVFNIGRAALLVSAFAQNRLHLLKEATEDMLHQPARSAIYPAMRRLIQSALIGGAHGAYLSGAGPTVMALTTHREMTVIYEMVEAARLHNLPGKIIVSCPVNSGGEILSIE